jgi:lipopolysaccharide biosynthesis regulator YciM
MSDKWHEMLDHLVNKNEDKAKEVFKNIMDTEKDNIMAQDAIEPEVVSTDAPVEDTPAE